MVEDHWITVRPTSSIGCKNPVRIRWVRATAALRLPVTGTRTRMTTVRADQPMQGDSAGRTQHEIPPARVTLDADGRTMRPTIAVVAVHGVGQHQPGASARPVA